MPNEYLKVKETYSFFKDVISGQNEGSVAALLLDHDAVDIRQLSRVEPGRPEATFLQDQDAKAVGQVAVLQANRSEHFCERNDLLIII